jgi:hypothetical protein
MAKYIDKERVVSLIKERRDAAISRQKNLEKIGDKSVLNEMVAFNLDKILETIDTLEVKEIHEDIDMDFDCFFEEFGVEPGSRFASILKESFYKGIDRYLNDFHQSTQRMGR